VLTKHKVLSGLAIGLFLLAFVAVTPPLRRVATIAASRMILFVASPFTPDIKPFEQLGTPATVVAKDGTVLGPVSSVQRKPIKLAEVPEHVKHAMLAAEDSDFYSHDGVDPSAVVRALLNMARGSPTQGGSTITQQLAKINYTDGQRSLSRKLKEVLYATELEKKHTKDELLERYLNQVYFGESTYGIGAAAERTFGVPAAELSVDQAAMLAARVRSPGNVDPRKDTDRALSTRNAVLSTMEKEGWITDEQFEEASAKPLAPIPLPPLPPGSQFLGYIEREVATLPELGATEEERLARVNNTPFIIESTLDVKAQQAASDNATRLLPAGAPSAAAVSVQPGDGAIRVLLGDSQGGGFDVASLGRRQPGSSFKPLVYVGALQKGIHPAKTYDSSSPKTLRAKDGTEFTVSNAEPGRGGPMSIDDALVDSVNVVFAQLVLDVGPERVAELARQLGYPPLEAHPSIALGGLKRGVSPLEQAAAFAAFANRGQWVEPYGVVRIKDGNREIFKHQGTKRQAISREQAAVLNRALLGVVTDGTGRRAAIGRQVAGKTGTTNDNVDAWFVGYTPQLATAVWVGFPEGARPMPDMDGRPVYGGTIPAEIFSATMRSALAGVPSTPLETMTPEELGLRLAGATPAQALPPPAPAANGTAPTAPPPTAAPPSVTSDVPRGRGGGPNLCPTTTASSSTTKKPNDNKPTTTSSSTTTTRPPPGC
jgi:penicillin-binding protein 1A